MRWSSKLPKLFGVMVLVACQTPVPDPPPAATPTELPSAAPGALGALAAGTDGAPRPDPSLFQNQGPDREELVPYPDQPPSAPTGGAPGAPPEEPNSVQL